MAHELDFSMSEGDVTTFVGLMDPKQQQNVERVASRELEIGVSPLLTLPAMPTPNCRRQHTQRGRPQLTPDTRA